MERKKNPKKDLSRRYFLYLNIGLSISLIMVIAAFEWPAGGEQQVAELGKVEDDFEDIMDIPPTQQPPPPPPKIQQPEIKEVPDEEEIEEEIELDLDVEVTEETVVDDIVYEEMAEEEVDQVFDIVEDQPQFPGGMDAFYKYVSDNMEYPSQARKMGLEGRVFVQFVVDKQGNVTEVKVVRGLGSGLDAEAKRVLEESPKFEPGKQRGRPVKVRMIIPIVFNLDN